MDNAHGAPTVQALRESEAMARALLNIPHAAAFMLDRQGVVLDANETLAERFGKKRADLIGSLIWDLFSPEVASRRRGYLQQAIASRQPVRFEDEREGMWNEFIVSPIVSDAGEVTKIAIVAVDVTERKRSEERQRASEERLRESEERYRQLVETANSVILRWDTTGTIEFINDFGERYFGFSKDELIGRNVVGTIVPEQDASGRDLAQLMQEIQRDPERFVDNENENVTRDGRRVWVRWANKAVTDRQGGIVGILSVGNDITGRKRAEEASAKSERLFQTIIDTEPECVKLLDEDANLILMNRAGLDMLEVSSLDEVKGKCVCPLVTSEYRPAFMELTKRIFRGESGTLLFEMVGVKGRRLWLETHAVPLRDERNRIVALLGVTRDVTERRKAEEMLRESEEFVRSILDTVDEGFIVVDRDYRIRTANRAYCAQVGKPSEEVVGRPCYQVSHRTPGPCHEHGEACAVREVFATGVPHTTSHRHTDGDGRLIHVETKAYPVKDAAGRVTSAIETVSNITERHLLEEERLKTQKLESIGTLAGGIAHDFNNMLQGIFGYISMTRLNVDRRDKALAMLDQAESALQQSVNLTTQLLTFSKGGKPVKKLTDLAPVIESATIFSMSGSRSEYAIRIPKDLWPADVDGGQIGQVIQNIVLNADQAMPAGGSVSVAAGNVAEADAPPLPGLARGSYVGIAIRDTGLGIPEMHLGKIFDPYFTTKEKGSGLGLATSYSIVRNHGGTIDVQSTPGAGSTFTIYLPAAPGAVGAAAPPPEPAPAQARAARVLVMDDDEVIRNLSKELFGALGHDVEVARDGEEALERYRDAMTAGRPFDVVILDLTVRGGMGGAETMQRLLEIDPAAKGIASSGYSDNATMTEHLALGFKAYLKKPYNIGQITEAFKKALPRGGGAAGP